MKVHEANGRHRCSVHKIIKRPPSHNMIEISDDSDFEVHSKVEKPCDTDSFKF